MEILGHIATVLQNEISNVKVSMASVGITSVSQPKKCEG